jgi:hypothetical protein
VDREGPPALRQADPGAEESEAAGGTGHLPNVTFERYQPLGRGWVAPEVVITVNGKEVQRERYRDIRADVPLRADLYKMETYRKAEWIGSR